MFYSQFILAKKGPLGTIWIAAHLERKLRKNQVADTDIGVSVDSIICPEVPIALRLSSHLLLGVVRIYSRKVNYLFHDCSEALLKIKQAFRSTAVDLPPEESTAPYHSITLPETFDLDDFEFPDAVLQGNFVDHHVSTKEQITLQDKVENTLYTATQFGLDERFGDGDTSHIGLDLNEELFLKKDPSLANASHPYENLEDRTSALPEIPLAPSVGMDVDECPEDLARNKTVNDSTTIPINCDLNVCQPNIHEHMAASDSSNVQGYNIRTPDLNQMVFPNESTRGPDAEQNYVNVQCPANNAPLVDLLGPAQAPSTPGLLEEAVPVHLQDAPSNHQQKNSPSNDAEEMILDSRQPETGCHNLEIKIDNPSLPLQCSDVPLREAVDLHMVDCEKSCERTTTEVHDGLVGSIQNNVPEHDQRMTTEVYNVIGPSEEHLKGVGVAPLTFSLSVDDKSAPTGTSEIIHVSPVDRPEFCSATQQEPAVVFVSSQSASTSDFLLQPCHSKDQKVGAHSEDLFVGDVNNKLLIETFATDNVQRDGGLSLEVQGVELSSADPVDIGLSTVQTTENVTQTNSYFVSQCPDPERLVISSVSTQPTYTGEGSSMVQTTENVPQTNSYFASQCPEPERLVVSSVRTQPTYTGEEHPAAVAVNSSNIQTAKDVNHQYNSCANKLPDSEHLMVTSMGLQSTYTSEELPSAAVVNTPSLLIPSTGTVTQMHNYFSSSEYQESERLMLSSKSTQSSHPCEELPSAIGINSCSLMKSTANVTQTNNHFASSKYPESERLMVASTSTHGLLDDREQFVGGKRMLEPQGSTQMYPSLSSSHGMIDAREQYTGGKRIFEPDGNAYIYPKVSSNPGLIDGRELYVSGKTILEPAGNAHIYPSQSDREHYPEPERIMMASTSSRFMLNGLEQFVGGRDGNTHLYHNLPTERLSFGEGTPAFISGSSVKSPGLPRSKRKASDAPDDDELLTSILGGRKRTMSSRAKDSQSLQLIPSSKRPRLTPKLGALKRKVLIDDTMVLHADTIRQQLMNTDDIRRMRKKAPCTRVETWMIHKFLLEDEVFTESILTGMSLELATLQYQIYNPHECVYPRVDSSHPPLESSKMALPKSPQVTSSVLVELDNLNAATALVEDATDVPVHSNIHLTSETRHEPSSVPGVDDSITGIRDTTQPRFATNDVIHSVSSVETHNSDWQDGTDIINTSSVSIDPCSCDLPPLEKNSGREASTLTMANEMTFNASHGSSEDASIPTVNACSIEDTANNSGSRNAVCDITKDAEGIAVMAGVLSLHSEKVSFNHTPDYMADGELTCNGDGGGPLENRNVIINEVHVTCGANENEMQIEEERVDVNIQKIEIGVQKIGMEKLEVGTSEQKVDMSNEEVETGEQKVDMNNGEVEARGQMVNNKEDETKDQQVDMNIEEFDVQEQQVDMNKESDSKEEQVDMNNREVESGKQLLDMNNEVETRERHVDMNSEGAGSRKQLIDTLFNNEEMSLCEEPQLFAIPDIATSSVREEVGALERNTEHDVQVASTHEMNPEHHVQLESTHEMNPEHDVQVVSTEDAGTTRDSCDLRSAVDENNHDTEFLNMDDEVDFDEEVDYDIPNPAEDQSHENSGWSTRTRGVARYLKLLFDDETGYGRKDAQLDRLLSGKTRKEASRMFFETLVLKTKDYIHVEQDVAFASIKIEPRSKLLKTTF